MQTNEVTCKFDFFHFIYRTGWTRKMSKLKVAVRMVEMLLVVKQGQND